MTRITKSEPRTVDEEETRRVVPKGANLDYKYLEEIRDYIHKDVVLADTKAGFSITIVTVSLAVCAALFSSLPSVASGWRLYVDIASILGLVCAAMSVFCSMTTLLPRSYISHEMARDKNSWIYEGDKISTALRRRALDAYHVVRENIWQKQAHGTPQSLKLLLSSSTEAEMVTALHEAMMRASLVQNMKFLWVGKALLFAFLSLALVSTAALISLNNPKDTDRPGSLISRLLDMNPRKTAR